MKTFFNSLQVILIVFPSVSMSQFYDVDFTAESPMAHQEANIIFADSWEAGC